MKTKNQFKQRITGLVGLVFILGSFTAHASTLEIQFTGLDLVYDGSDIYDATNIVGSNGNPAESDPLNTMNFLVDGNLVGSQTTDIYADVYISDVLNIPTTGGTVSTNGGFFDLLTSSNNPGWGLGLDFSEAEIIYVVGGGIEIAIFGAAAASICESCTQMLPFGLEMGDPVTLSFSSTNFTTSTNGVAEAVTSTGVEYLTGFTASSDGTVTGALVPVPAAVWLFGSGLLGLVGIARRKKTA